MRRDQRSGNLRTDLNPTVKSGFGRTVIFVVFWENGGVGTQPKSISTRLDQDFHIDSPSDHHEPGVSHGDTDSPRAVRRTMFEAKSDALHPTPALLEPLVTA